MDFQAKRQTLDGGDDDIFIYSPNMCNRSADAFSYCGGMLRYSFGIKPMTDHQNSPASQRLENDTDSQWELIVAGANTIADLASVVFPTNIECARCVIHAIEDAGYEIRKKKPAPLPENEALPHCGDCIWVGHEWCCTMNCSPCTAGRKIYV